MEHEEIRVESKLCVGGVILIPIVENACSGWQYGKTVSFSGCKRPLFIVVFNGDSKTVYRIDGEEISFEKLIEEFPSIKEIIEKL